MKWRLSFTFSLLLPLSFAVLSSSVLSDEGVKWNASLSFRRDATAQLRDAFHFISSSNLLPYAKKQIKRLEEMYDEIRRAFYDDDDDDLY